MPAPSIDALSLRLPRGQYVDRPEPKDLVVMHHTAGGSAASSVSWWRQTDVRVATAYIIERDGTIYECFDPGLWAYHLGASIQSLEERSIGIELANWGGLKHDGATYRTWSGAEIPKTAVHDHGRSWRGFRYYEAYPKAQLDAAIALAAHLVERFGIAPDVAPAQLGSPDVTRFRKYRGVVAHHHVRADKSDISPAFPWDRLTDEIEALASDPDVPPPAPQVPKKSLGVGDGGDRVVLLQKRLAEMGYNVGPADGDFGPRTLAAVLAAQRDAGLLADGIVGPQTAATLGLSWPDLDDA
ncbi:peptidoglycan recognition protein family protein [Rubrivirga marina]|uniref:N-acetylmuramoyl-L-alanine amidase n=1 Tax=Rubrivirga marina TaxID=1196024 RepID=A0A271J291_9BACT|nr:N-acetylmuramoyl-L-alanine amidase [Rubrivirga marina]PAP77612.1 hypothetical protein BSZ37_14760 [Rubrivirga marina]